METGPHSGQANKEGKLMQAGGRTMDCPECQRLKEEEFEASLQYGACDDALTILCAQLRAQEKVTAADLDRWKAHDAAVYASHEHLKKVRQRAWEHRRAHSGPPPTIR